VSGAEKALAPAEWERHAEACARMREAEEGLHAAMAALKSAAMTWARVEADVSGDKKVEALIGIAASNGATWSGGVTNENNIIETVKRREALELLRRIA
jgi:hypothetical protein